MAAPPIKSSSSPVLDQWRACAALAVFAHHFFQQYQDHFENPAAQALLSHLGPWGVSIFFVISGFCIHWGRLAKPEAFSLRDYALRRFLPGGFGKATHRWHRRPERVASCHIGPQQCRPR